VVRSHVLDNGVLLLFDEVRVTDVVSLGFWFDHGSRDESARERGFSHFLEHMLFKGTKKRNTFEIARDVDRVGGMLNAFTENELTCFYCTLPKDHLSLAVDVLSDMVFCSLVAREEIDKEKSVVINEILSSHDLPEQMAYEAFLKGIWGDHPLAQKIAGDVGDVRRIERDALLSFYRSRYVTEDLAVAAAGNFHPDALVELIAESLQGLRGGRAVRDNGNHRKPPRRFAQWEHSRGRSAQVQIYAGVSIGKEDLPALYAGQVFSSAVGESMSSRLFQQIREKLALCYSISCFRTLYSDCSLWTVFTSTKPEQVGRLVASLNAEFRRLHEEPLSPTEVDDAKSFLKGSLILSKEDMEVRMKRLIRLQHVLGRVMEYEESLNYIDTVTTRDVEGFTSRTIRNEEFNLLAYGGRRISGFNETGFDF